MKRKECFHHLHQYKYLWNKCTQREVVIKAWKKLRKGKGKRREVQRIEKNFEHYVDLMIETLKNTRPGGDPEKAFKPKILRSRQIFEHGKPRQIYCPPIWDQWVHHIIIQVLGPIVTKFSYKYSCGSMPNRGGVYGKRELARVIKKKGFKYFAKLDIRHFFNSTRVDIVIKELKIFVDDDWFIYMIRVIFQQFPKGLPLGFYISQWLANFVLCRVDWLISRIHPDCYIRYMDDFVIGDDNKKFLHGLIIKIAKCLGKLRLRLKSNYQVIRFVYEKSNGKVIGRPIDFMGFVFTKTKVILRKRIMLRAVRMAAKVSKLKIIALHQAQGLLSRIGWFKHTNTKYLYITKIQPLISISSLKGIVRKYQRRYDNYENGVAERALQCLAAGV